MKTRSLMTTATLLLLLGACDDDDESSSKDLDASVPTGIVDAPASAVDGGSDGAVPTSPVTQKFYAVPSEIYTADFATSTSYVPIVPSLDVATIPLNTAREFDGRASMATVGKWLFLASSSSPVVNRFEVDANGKLVEAGTLNFSNYGVPEFFAIDDWGAVFVSETKAYIFNGSDGSHVVWNPSTMTITGQIPGPPGIVKEGYALESVSAVSGKLMYRIFTLLNYDTWDFLPSPQYLVVYDTTTDTIVSQSEESRCPQLYNRPFVDEAGDIYFSGWVWTPVIALVDPSYPKACALRVKAGTNVFDPSYKLDFGAQITQGREAGVLRYLGNGKALLDVFHAERVTITKESDPEELANTANWRLWQVDLKTNVGSPVEGLDFKAGGYTDVKVEERPYLMVPNKDYSETTAHELVNGIATPRFKITGSSYNMARVR